MTTETTRRHYPIYGKGVTSATYDRYGEGVIPRRAEEYVEVEKNSVPADGAFEGCRASAHVARDRGDRVEAGA